MEEQIKKVEHRSLSEQIYESIKTMILQGKLKGGERIPEEGLASQFGVSRTPIREALRRLDEYGIVKIIPRSYAEVTILTDEEVIDILQVRKALESLSVKLLTNNHNALDIKKLREISNLCSIEFKNKNKSKVFELDSLFHLNIAMRSKNKVLFDSFERLDAKIQLTRLKQCSIETFEENLKLHEDIINAIENNDSKQAVSLMKNHIA